MAAKKYKYTGTYARNLPSGRLLAVGEVVELELSEVRDFLSQGLLLELEDEKEAATEAAIKLAQKEGVNLSAVTGSGTDGKITVDDVQAAATAAKEAAAAAAAQEGEEA